MVLSPRSVRILASLGVPVALILIYCYFFGAQTAFTLMARHKYRDLPRAAKTPVPLRDLSISSTPHTKISYFGYEFELPWDDVDDQKSKTAGPIHVTAFRSGNALWFSHFPPRDFVNSVIKSMKMDPDVFRRAYGDDAFHSDYSFYTLLLAVTPSKITPFISTEEASRDTSLLLLKAIAVPEADSGVFFIRAADCEGFQFGDPKKAPPKVRDDLFADEGGIEFIFFVKERGSVPTISQAEINRVLQNVRKVPDVRSAALR